MDRGSIPLQRWLTSTVPKQLARSAGTCLGDLVMRSAITAAGDRRRALSLRSPGLGIMLAREELDMNHKELLRLSGGGTFGRSAEVAAIESSASGRA